MATPSRTHNAYTVGWVCALPKEQTAAIAMLDERHPNLSKPPNDPNSYTLGSICGHNIVIACLPKGKIGISSAATVATHMVDAFPAVRFGLMVGIGGGVPPKVRLGDVVVSVPVGQFPGVVQWDMGKAEQGGIFRRTGALNNPPNLLLSALAMLESDHELEGSKISQYLEELQIRYPRLAEKYLRSDSLQDVLFKASYGHVEKQDQDASEEGEDGSEDDTEEDCQHCDKTQIVKRKPRDMRVHYGLIASGNQVIKDASVRDQLSKDMDKKVLCIEMEAAGLMDNVPCFVIRGICDYADSHKNKAWQKHAAAVAAAFAKELLGYIQPQEVEKEDTVKDILNKVFNEVSETKSEVVQTRRILERDEDLKVVNWLSPIDFGPQHSDYLRRREPGTGQWLLNHETYQKWVEEPGQKLFCPGIPGAGKTILSSIVIHDLKSRFSSDRATVVVYVYCNFNRKAEQRLDHLMSSLLKQLAHNSPSLPPVLHELYREHAKNQTTPTLEEISMALRTVTTAFARVFIVVDALDECQVADNCRTRFLHQLCSLQSQQGVSVFATSRHMPDIEKEFSGSSTIEIRASEDDIGRYLRSAVSRLPEFVGKRSDLQDEITQAISQIVDGMFLLAQLYCDTLMDKYNPAVLRKALEDMKSGSKSYTAAYDGAMKRIEGQLEGQANLAKQVLAWITCAQRPLTKTELQLALAVEIGETKLNKDNITQVHDMVSVCAGLVTIDEASSTVRLVHYTTQKYFESTQGRWFPAAHSELATTCTTYLSFETFADGRCQSDQEFEDRLKEHQLFEYAASYWGNHARAAPECKEVLGFLRKPAQIDASIQAYFTDTGTQWRYPGYSQNAPSGIVPTHLAAVFGLGNILSAVWNKRDQDAKDSTSRTPLSRAAENGHTRVVQLLLETKEVDADAKDKNGRTPLLLAAENGHTQVVQLLLETKEVDVNAQGGYYGNALQAASEGGHQEIVQLLVDNGADVNAQGGDYGNALYTASEGGHQEIVQLLVNNGADVNAQGGYYGNALQAASSKGHRKIVQILVDNGANVNAQGGSYGNALQAAAVKGHSDVIQLLLRHGADMRVLDTFMRPPFFYAIRAGEPTSLSVLKVSEFLDPEFQDLYGSNALSVAVRCGHEEIIRDLISEQSLMAADRFGRTPVWWAHKQGYMHMVEHIATHPGPAGPSDLPSGSPAKFAAEGGYCDVCLASLEEAYYKCKICCAGSFAMCLGCFDVGARCLADNHNLTLSDR